MARWLWCRFVGSLKTPAIPGQAAVAIQSALLRQGSEVEHRKTYWFEKELVVGQFNIECARFVGPAEVPLDL